MILYSDDIKNLVHASTYNRPRVCYLSKGLGKESHIKSKKREENTKDNHWQKDHFKSKSH